MNAEEEQSPGITAFPFYLVKFASFIESPAWAQAILAESDPY